MVNMDKSNCKEFLCKILDIFPLISEHGEINSESNESSLQDNDIEFSERTIVMALEQAQSQLYEIDYTQPIYVEVGPTDRQQQEASFILG